MALSNVGVVDATSISNEQKRVILTIVDDLSWDTSVEKKKQHMKLVETKMNNYFKFITSGQVLDNYPESVGYGVAIVIQCKYPITLKVKEIYTKIAEALKKRDIVFGYFVEPQEGGNAPSQTEYVAEIKNAEKNGKNNKND